MTSKRKEKSDSSESSESPSQSKKPKPWQMGLLKAMKDPASVVTNGPEWVVIKDKYPKAKHHLLVCAKNDIAGLCTLSNKHVHLLEDMFEAGKKTAESAVNSASLLRFRFGYHAVPSMSRLHMHVISEDFDSPCLKTKKHWLSFTSPFFKNAGDVIEELKSKGSITVDKKAAELLLTGPLKCHKCDEILPNIPKLKDHLKIHFPKQQTTVKEKTV